MNIALVCRNAVLRDSLNKMLSQITDFRIVFESDVFTDLSGIDSENQPDVLVVDSLTISENNTQFKQIALIFSEFCEILILTDPDESGEPDWMRTGIRVHTLSRNALKAEFEKKIREMLMLNLKSYQKL